MARGFAAVQDAVVTDLLADQLQAGQTYDLVLAVGSPRGVTTAEASVHTTDPTYTLIPLEQGNLSREQYAIYSGDASGNALMYSGEVADPAELVILDRRMGRRDSISVRVGSSFGVKLSGDGSRLFFYGAFPELGTLGLGYINLRTGNLLSVAPQGSDFFSTAASGRRLVYQGVAPGQTLQYFLFDEDDVETRQMTNQPGAIDFYNERGPCPPLSATTPLIAADGSMVVLITSATLGLVPPEETVGCRIFTYEVETRRWRHLAALPYSHILDAPYLSADGRWLSFIVSRQLPSGIGGTFPVLMDVESGELSDPVVDLGDFTSFDSIITGDSNAVVISTQADPDPRVGNDDHNMELFYYDRSTKALTQITETVGGVGRTPNNCPSYRPYVSHDASVVMLGGFPRFSVAGCNLDGPQRSERDGFWFRFVRAVRKRPGNQEVTFGKPPDQRVVAGDVLSLTFTANDPDGDPITFFAQVKDGFDVPPGSEITDHHDGTATFRWPTRPEHVGSYTLRVAAFDEGGGEVFHDVTINVVPQASPSTPTGTPSPTAPPTAPCVGDCDSNGEVSVGELVTGVGIVLETTPITVCPAFDCNATSTVTVSCLTQAVNAALTGCSE